MNTAAIIAEYNPFHNGHKFHIEEARKITGADYIFTVMSSSFVQRGECAIYDKWCRTKAALACGADIVAELPIVYSTASAEGFARGSVKIISSSGIADSIVFGSESDNLSLIEKTADILYKQPDNYRNSLKIYLNNGLSFPVARELALKDNGIDSNLLLSPNNILAVEYVKALKEFSAPIQPYIVHRTSSEFNSEEINGSIASATAIRKALQFGNIENISSTIPFECFNLFKKEQCLFPDDFSFYLNYLLRILSSDKLRNISGISEGLENRILNTVGEFRQITELCSILKTKRYTYTRLMRILFHIILGITKEHDILFSPIEFEPYIRILGFRQSALPLIKSLTANSSVPVVMNINKDYAKLNQNQQCLLELEKKATNIYFAPHNGKLNRDLTMPLIVAKDL